MQKINHKTDYNKKNL